LFDQGEGEVLGVDGLVAELDGEGLGALERFLGFLGEFGGVHMFLSNR
jgi:hypothetical protein